MDYEKVSFSINQYDEDGDAFDECVLIHLDSVVSGLILRFDNVADIDKLAQTLKIISKEIRGKTTG